MAYKFRKIKDSEISTKTLEFNQCFDDEKGNADIIVELYDKNYETYGDGFFVCKYNYNVDVDTSHYVGEDLKDEYKIKPEDCKITDVDIISVEMVDFNEDNKSYIENGNKMKDILLKDKEFAKSILKDYCMDYIVKKEQDKRDKHFSRDSKPVNDVIIKYISELELSLKSANTYASQLAKQIPEQKPTTNEEKELYNGNYVKTFETISDNIQHWYKELEEYKKKLSTAHVVAEEILEEFPLKARNELRNSTNIDETYKSLVEDLKNRYNSMEDKEKYKQQVLKMKKDLDGFYKSFKK